jgi:hypothetical protein
LKKEFEEEQEALVIVIPPQPWYSILVMPPYSDFLF